MPAKSVQTQGSTCLVSAIVSTYNSERFISECIEDLESQTIADRLEIIIVDSGSQQNEGKIVRELQQKFENITYLRTEEKETLYSSWNRCLRVAHGNYITNANTDDRHHRDAFACLASVLDHNPETALAYGDVFVTATENETFEKHTRIGHYTWYDWDRNNLLDIGCFVGPQPMWRRSVHEVFGYFDDSLQSSGDYEFWLRISQTFNFYHVRTPLGLYLKSPDSIEHRNNEIKTREDTSILNRYRNAADQGVLINYKPIEHLDKTEREKVSRSILESTSWWPARQRRNATDIVINKANELYLRGEFDQAVQMLFQSIKSLPDYKRPYYCLVEILIAKGHTEDALHILHNIPPAIQDSRHGRFIEECLKKKI